MCQLMGVCLHHCDLRS
uniref:Uncharacterized protein n=1 Tax=Anguilla anguilla TaxID=7936 RepID=A0A0E9TAC0_ANGAN